MDYVPDTAESPGMRFDFFPVQESPQQASVGFGSRFDLNGQWTCIIFKKEIDFVSHVFSEIVKFVVVTQVAPVLLDLSNAPVFENGTCHLMTF
jgi:hypothetical protein